MKVRSKINLSLTGFICFVVLILMVRFVDVAPIGPKGTNIGLSHLNKVVFDLIGTNLILYRIADYLCVSAIALAVVFAFVGLIQLIKRKSLVKVDKEILALGVLYIIVISLYILFEKAIVNYRPIIMPGCTEPEASFPSSHTMVTLVIFGTAIGLFDKYVKDVKLRTVLKILSTVIIAVTLVCRLLSGVHWFTDILGGFLIGITLISLYDAVRNFLNR